MYGRSRLLVSGCCLVVMLLGCTDPTSDGPTEPQFAKGGKGKPGSSSVALEEYWVYAGPSGDNLIHVVGSGDVDLVNPGTAFDHFFNGIRDDDPPTDEHFEFGYGGPPAASTEVLPDGRWHADVSWNGLRSTSIYASGDYRDSPVTDVNGADPFAISLRLMRNGKSVLGPRHPNGIIEGGIETGLAEATVNGVHGLQTVTSYATFAGDPAEGTVSLAALSMTSPQCEVVEQVTGHGKKAVVNTVHMLSATVDIALQLNGPVTIPVGNVSDIAWLELHFRNAATGMLTGRHTLLMQEVTHTFVMESQLADDATSFPLELVVDYVYPIGFELLLDYAYDPDLNAVTTTAGFGGPSWSNGLPQVAPGNGRFPVAATGSVTVVCG